VSTFTLPISSLAEEAEKAKSNCSTKLLNLVHVDEYDGVLPQGMKTVALAGTLANADVPNVGAIIA